MENTGTSTTQLIIFDGTVLNGTGTIRMGNEDGNQIVAPNFGDRVLTQGSEHTIAGSGNIGANQMGLINNGTIKADQSVPLMIDPVDGDLDGLGTDFINNGALCVDEDSALTLTGGRFANKALGTIDVHGSLNVTGSAILENFGTIRGAGTFTYSNSNAFVNSAVVNPGDSVGELNFVGDFDQAFEGILEIEIASASISDQLIVNGDFMAGGIAIIKLIDGFEPDPTDQFTIVSANRVSGLFVNGMNGTLSLFGGKFDVSYNDGLDCIE